MTTTMMAVSDDKISGLQRPLGCTILTVSAAYLN
jgi:hypothetical protein